MAGTLIIGVRPVHIYQRRFDSKDLAFALRNSHLYLISRRPQVRLDPASLMFKHYAAKVDAYSRREGSNSIWRRKILLRPAGGEPILDFKLHADGSYFSLRTETDLIHGDAWALASFHSGAAEEVAGQEVLYIGKAYGTDGSSNVWKRTKNHEKLPRIYEDHLSGDWDIFVTPLEVEYVTMESDDHIDDMEGGPDLSGYYGVYLDLSTGRVLAPTIDLVEHALIAHFVPHYNKDHLREWCAARPTADMRLMRAAGFRLLKIHFNGFWGLSRFYSRQAPEKVRSHLILHDIPPNPSPEVKRGIGAQDLENGRSLASMVPHGHRLLADAAEWAGVALHVFGKEAPEERRPPEVSFGD